jgi:hypothetical protein
MCGSEDLVSGGQQRVVNFLRPFATLLVVSSYDNGFSGTR